MSARKMAWALGFFLAGSALDAVRDVAHVDWLLPFAVTCKVMFWVVLVAVLVEMVRDLRGDRKVIREGTGVLGYRYTNPVTGESVLIAPEDIKIITEYQRGEAA